MAFIGNRCQWKGCGKSFSELRDLIAHVEQTHIADTPVLQEVEGPSPRPNVEEVCVPMSVICPSFPRISRDYQPVEKPTPELEETRQEEMKRQKDPGSFLSQMMPPPSLPSASPVYGGVQITGTGIQHPGTTTYQQASRGGFGMKHSLEPALPAGTERSTYTMASASPRQLVLKVGQQLGGEIRSREDHSSLWPIAQSNGTPVEHIQMSAAEDRPKKPFPCSVSGCGKRYKKPSGLEQHMRKEHGLDSPAPRVRKIFHCTMCDKAYMTARSLQQHCEKHHNKAMVSPQCSMQPRTPSAPESGAQATPSCLQPQPPPSPGNGTQAIHYGMRPQTPQYPSNGTQAMRHGIQPQISPSPSKDTQASPVGTNLTFV